MADGGSLRFGSFELDLGSRELRSRTKAVRLQEQPFVVLQLLVERRGQVVTRDELRERLWPAGTFVDFEHSLNAAIKRLRAALGDDADNPKFVETIPRRGYRFIADPDEPEAPRLASPDSRARLAILPFAELDAHPQDDYFSVGFTDEMISELGRRSGGGLAVISSHSSRSFRNTIERARDIGLALRADYLLEGSIRRNGGRVRITARLVETSSETQLWVETYEQPLTDWISAQAEIAARIARSLAMELLPVDRVATAHSSDPAAYAAYLKGRYHYQRTADTGINEAQQFFAEAVTRDPSYAAAHAGIGMIEVMRALYYYEKPRCALERARLAAERTLQLDPAVPEGYLVRGDVCRLLLWDASAARAAYAEAIALNPSLEYARTAYARLLVSLGRFAQAVREADRGRELDPRCLTANTLAAWARYATQDYDAAIDLCRHTLELDDSHVAARQLLGAALLASGSRKEALRVLEQGVDVPDPQPMAIGALAHARAVTGDRTGAADLVTSLERFGERRYVPPYCAALAYTGLGDLDAAFDALRRARDDHDPAVTNLAIEPRLLPLRSDAQYRQLLADIGLRPFHVR